MSGVGKKVADVAFKASRTIDWEGMAKLLVTEEARKEFFTLRRAFDDVNSQLQTKFSQEPEPIDWEYYRKGIGARLVDMYKEAYDSVEIPKFVDTVTPQYKTKFDALLIELKEAEEKSLKESERIEKEIIEVKELKILRYSCSSCREERRYPSPLFGNCRIIHLNFRPALTTMSGVGKKVADVAFKASRTIDWEGMAKLLVTEEARKEFFTLRRAFDDVNSQLQTKFSQEPEPIDWEYYRKGIGSRLVDMYKEAYDSVEIPKFVDTVTPQYKTKFDALLIELKEAEEKSLKESERIEKEIVEVKELKEKIATMTADEYFEKHPELKKKFDDEIRNDYWGY